LFIGAEEFELRKFVMEPNKVQHDEDPRTSNVEAENVDDFDKLKGDAIGSTLYSESVLLKTLITLSEQTGENWSDQLEEQLCFLWDMTFEEDVVTLLMEHDFVNLACHVIRVTSEPRLIEILVGILGNMTALKSARKSLSQLNTAEQLLSLLSSSDTPTLLQLVRLLNTCVWHVNRSSHTPDGQDEDEKVESQAEADVWVQLLSTSAPSINENLSFILRSSTNGELLQSTLELLNNLCCISSRNHYYSEFLSTEVMLQGLTESLHQLLNVKSLSDTNNIVWEDKIEKAAQHWSQTLSTFTLHDAGVDLIYTQRQIIMRSICCILDPLCSEENIFPVNAIKFEVLDSIVDILDCLKNKRNYCPPAILPRLLTIFALMSPLKENHGENEWTIMVNEEDSEKHAEILKRLHDYCLSVLCDIESQDFLEGFGDESILKVRSLLASLQKCSDNAVHKLVEIINHHLK
ncbi:Protein SAAL1, partial [Frankliniella fusca]